MYHFGDFERLFIIKIIANFSEGGIRWMPVGKMHYARHWFAAVRYENNIWAIGGELTGTTELFHSETNGTDIIKIENFKPPKGHAAVILPRHD